MCGICGVFEFGSGERPVDEKILLQMRDTLTHRGPDDAGLYISPDGRLGFGHRRLSIIDLSPAGRQPMSNEDGSIWITFNGEIYNHAGLRAELEAKGHRYRSRTDTETLVHLYEEEGPDFVRRIEGDFAIALWDGRRQELLMARDRLGVKPLYYAVLPGTVLFGSEIKAILAHPRMSRRIDLAALYHYLTFIVAPAPRTLFQGVHKLPPATRVVVSRDGLIRSDAYWDPLLVPPETGARHDDAAFCADRIRDLLARAIEKRMMSDVPFGVFLSGGLDSSANVALMARQMDRPVRTFSVGFRDHPSYNEFEYARRVAALFKTEHHEVVIGAKDLLDYMPRLIFHQDEPIADWVCVPLHYVSKLARDSGTIVIQVGEGSDEQFFGYETYRRAWEAYGRYFERLLRLPRSIRAGAYTAARGLAFLLHRDGDRLEMMRKAARDETFFWGGAIAWSERDKRRLLSERARERMDGLTSHEVVLEHVRQARRLLPGADFGQIMTYLEIKNRLAELLLMRVDKVTMASSIEARVPYLDHALVEFTTRIPTALRLQGGTTKYLLKKAMAGILPDDIIHRPKQGFGAPVSEWFRGELYQPAIDSVLGSNLRHEGLFDYDLVRSLFEAHRKGARDHSWHLWTLYNLSRWYDYWIAEREAA
ncbi:MAG TPA: asparagine synthase (glutamine-hydrolyzing) [Candidatus Polarisedimenticolia bacterium]|nr:asparagine synthase (glutamine-hydrolyzing) [Candidatus Polarisedimenticolia bacterium]